MPHDFGTPPSQVWLYVDRFVIDESYQRAISTTNSQKLIAKIAADFRWSAFQAVLAAPAEDNHWTLIDGHHRIEGAKRIRNGDGSPAIPMVPATVIDAKSPEAQADACVRVNSDRRPFDALALHRAKLVQGDAKAATIDRLVTAASLTIPAIRPSRSSVRPGEIICLGALSKLVNHYSSSIAQEAIAVVAEAYRAEPFGVRAPFLLAAAELLSSGETDAALLLRAFKQSTSDALCREVGGHNTAKSTINVLAVLRQRIADQKAKNEKPDAVPQKLPPYQKLISSVPIGLSPDIIGSISTSPVINEKRRSEEAEIAARIADHGVTKCPSGPAMENVPFMEYDKHTHKWKRSAS